MRARKATRIDIGNVPEVVELIDAQDALEAFKQSHPEIFRTLEALTERYNAALESAEKVCRARAVSCGPLHLYQFTTRYDAEALYGAVGREKFLELGGKVGTKATYEVDKTCLETAIAQNKLSAEIVEISRKETPNFHKPDRLVLP